MRLDKYISTVTTMSRTDVKKIIKKGVIVNDTIIKSADYKVDENIDIVIVAGEKLVYKKYIYIMMNKPQNIISATEDKSSKTVVDLLQEEDSIFNPFPVGRLDKDTEGLIFLTNDGALAHKLLSPKKDVEKKYYVEVDGFLDEKSIVLVKEGIVLSDFTCKPGKLEILSNSLEKSTAYITITEGKFHQVKRMMKSLGTTVTYLKRLTIGSLVLDENLKLGEYRYLTDNEIKKLIK